MPIQDDQRKHGSTRGSPRRRESRTAKASRINRSAAKSGCAYEWGGWDQLSDDGPGQHNPDRSEGPWGRAAEAAQTEVCKGVASPDTVQGTDATRDAHEGRKQTVRREQLAVDGKAPSDIPALKPYRGKPALRNFRGDGGNVGIIRSPVRATLLPGELK